MHPQHGFSKYRSVLIQKGGVIHFLASFFKRGDTFRAESAHCYTPCQNLAEADIISAYGERSQIGILINKLELGLYYLAGVSVSE